MVNTSLNWSSIAGIVLAIWGLIVFPLAIAQIIIFSDENNGSKSMLKITYIFIVTPLRVIGSFLIGGILFFQGWRLDPILQFGMNGLVLLYLSESIFGSLRDLIKLLQRRRNT